MPVTGFISESWVGWPTSYYLFAGIGVVWTIAWVFLGANKPSLHKYISKEEREYIEKSLGHEDHKEVRILTNVLIYTEIDFVAQYSMAGNSYFKTIFWYCCDIYKCRFWEYIFVD